jgi:hypothetical protein
LFKPNIFAVSAYKKADEATDLNLYVTGSLERIASRRAKFLSSLKLKKKKYDACTVRKVGL